MIDGISFPADFRILRCCRLEMVCILARAYIGVCKRIIFGAINGQCDQSTKLVRLHLILANDLVLL